MLSAIVLIICGLVLIGTAGNSVPVIGKYLVKAGSWLSPFALIIGIVAIVIGIIELL